MNKNHFLVKIVKWNTPFEFKVFYVLIIPVILFLSLNLINPIRDLIVALTVVYWMIFIGAIILNFKFFREVKYKVLIGKK